MALELTENTLHFQKGVKTLIDKGLAKNQSEIIKAIGWNKPTMSAVMKGGMNVPEHIFIKFKNVYKDAIANNNEDYKDKYIALLESQIKEKDKRIDEVITKLNSDFAQMKQHLNINSAYVKVLYQVTQLHRSTTEDVPLKKIQDETGKLYAEALAEFS